jgi:lipopolysaccharide export system protein LptC
MGKFRYIVILLIVLAIAFFTRWLLTSVEEPDRVKPDKLRHDPDYFVSNVKSVIYDKDGKPAYRFEAEHMEHFPDNNSMEIKKLKVSMVDKDGQTWLVFADQGILYKPTEILQLDENVIVRKDTKINAEKLELQTDTLRVDFASRIATSPSAVKMLGQNSTISAVGMKIDMTSGVLTLLSNAKGHYEPR